MPWISKKPDLKNDPRYLEPKINENASLLAQIVTINVKSFGAKGDGITDDSTAIQNAISAMPKTGGKLLFPPGVYIHGDGNTTGYSYEGTQSNPRIPIQDDLHPVDIGRDIRFIFDGYENLTVSGYGATIQSHDKNGECRNNSIFTFINCKNLKIEGIKIDARSQYRLPKLSDYNTGEGYADRHNLWVRYGENITLEDVESNYSMLDGIIVSGSDTVQPKNVRIINCNCYYNYRQGLTISSVKDCVVDGGNYSYTGVLRGTLPMAGIDLEADSQRNYNVVIKNATIENNQVSGVIFSYRSSNCRVENCKFIGKGLNSVNDVSCDNNVAIGNTFINCGIGLSQYGLTVKNNIFIIDRISGYIVDTNNYTEFADGKVDVFENNIIQCSLENITGTSGYVGGIRLPGSRKMKFKDNIIKNSCSLENTSVVILGSGCEVVDNQIIFDYSGTNVTSDKTIISIGGEVVQNNSIKGYQSNKVQGSEYNNPFGASSNSRVAKTFNLLNKIGSFFKIKSSYTGTLRVYNFGGEYVEYFVRYNLSSGAFTCTYSSRVGSTTFCNVYKKGTDVYIEPLENNVVVSIDYVRVSASGSMNPLGVTLDFDATIDKTTLSLVTVG